MKTFRNKSVDIDSVISQYKHCCVCGGKLVRHNELAQDCNECTRRFYHNPRPCSALILENDKRELLFVRRKVEPHKGMLDLPGGFVDLNESGEESAVREAKEELGIEIERLLYVGSYYDEYIYSKMIFPTLSFVFYTQIGDSSIKVSDDVDGYEFFSREDLPIETVGFESLKLALSDFLKKDIR